MTEFSPGRDIQAISHVNVVVDDIEVATEFYGTVLGFEQAVNAAGPMDYPGVDLASFARNAGLDDGRISLDISSPLFCIRSPSPSALSRR